MERVNVDQAQAMMRENMRQMRKVYTQMRDIAQKRIKRMGQTEFSQSKTYQINKEGFKKLKDLDPRDFAKAFSELSKFVTAKGSTVTGQRAIMQKTMRKLNEAVGADEGAGVTPSNYWRVIDILERARSQKIVYGSDKMVELAESTMALTSAQFADVLDNLEDFLKHSDEVRDSMEEYMDRNDISDYQKVDMDDFIEQIGW